MAETVIGALEDAEDYKGFEAAIVADYDTSQREQCLDRSKKDKRVRAVHTDERSFYPVSRLDC
jgi:hypothetical protein